MTGPEIGLIVSAVVASLIVGMIYVSYGNWRRDFHRDPNHRGAGPEPAPIHCPRCDSADFYSGPEGGMCINIKCADCGAYYNYTGGILPLEPITGSSWGPEPRLERYRTPPPPPRVANVNIEVDGDTVPAQLPVSKNWNDWRFVDGTTKPLPSRRIKA